jgi:hypothetical protein
MERGIVAVIRLIVRPVRVGPGWGPHDSIADRAVAQSRRWAAARGIDRDGGGQRIRGEARSPSRGGRRIRSGGSTSQAERGLFGGLTGGELQRRRAHRRLFRAADAWPERVDVRCDRDHG